MPWACVAGARRRHADDLGDLPHPEDRASAALHPVARHRRVAQDRHHRLGRVLPDRHRDLQRHRQRAAQSHPHGAELRPAGARHHPEDRPALGAAGILAGFRISMATALLLVVTAEMIGAQFGIGAFLLTAGNLMQTDDLMAGVVILSILGLGLGAILTALEKAFLSWR